MRRSLGFCLGLGLALTTGAALAQEEPAPDKPPEKKAAPEVSEAARQWFHRGVQLLEDVEGMRYEEAYLAFKKAYAISHSPKILGNLGLCAMKLERDGEAIDAYQRYLAEVDDVQPDERQQIEHDLKLLADGVAHLRLRVAPDGAMAIDERIPIQGGRIRNPYGPVTSVITLRLHPGQHHVIVQLEGYADQSVDLNLEPGAQAAREVTMKAKAREAAPPSSEKGPVPAGVWATLGITAALGVGAAISGGLAAANHGNYASAIAAADAARADDLASRGKGLNIAADVLIGATAAAGVTTLVLLFALPREAPSRENLPRDAPAKESALVPLVAPTQAGLAWIGRF